MVDEALLPGRLTDIDHHTREPGQRGVSFDAVPPTLVGSLRVLGVYVTPTGGGEGVVGLLSEHGLSALSSMTAAGGAGWLLPGVIGRDGWAEVIVYDDNATLGGVDEVLVHITAESLVGVDAINIRLDTNARTATWEPLDVASLATLSGYTVESLEALRLDHQTRLDTPSREVAVPTFSLGAPVTS
jgi:hypothetical protein